jgi:hypothetical protein
MFWRMAEVKQHLADLPFRGVIKRWSEPHRTETGGARRMSPGVTTGLLRPRAARARWRRLSFATRHRAGWLHAPRRPRSRVRPFRAERAAGAARGSRSTAHSARRRASTPPPRHAPAHSHSAHDPPSPAPPAVAPRQCLWWCAAADRGQPEFLQSTGVPLIRRAISGDSGAESAPDVSFWQPPSRNFSGLQLSRSRCGRIS